MGFFSWNCKGCGESIKAPYDLPDELAWQNEIISIAADNTLVSGNYDGYGRIEGYWADDELGRNPEVWHGECWVKAGKPTKYSGASDYAEDQGFFYGCDCDVNDEDNWPDPLDNTL